MSYVTTLRASRVLLIEDDPILLNTMSSTLRLKLPHAQIETAESVLTSLERIRSVEYEAILADGQQPRLEGIGFVRAVHKIDPQCPVLLLVEKHQEDLLRQATDAGAYDVLVKPVDEGTLLLAVHRAIEVSRLRHQVAREHAEFVASVGRTMRDLEVLYGAYGLGSHFDAFMGAVERLTP
ncbi:MAG TPA: response regulator [Nitrospira sp.]|jgi:DNA-binding NtrC family response regulator|nr:response regulator [Nitrospira sp.]